MNRPFVALPRRGIATACLLACLLAAQGCAVTLVSKYDEATDKAVSALQKKTETHFVTLESAAGTPACKYEKHKDFYAGAKVDVSAVAVRAAAIPNNDITTAQALLLSDSLDKLESLHKFECLSGDQIKPLRIQFNASYTAILKLELAKRRGE